MEIPDFLNRLKKRVDTTLRKHLYKNLVFKGGGVRGIAYIGALEELDNLGIVNGIQRVAGTSAGAIAATLACFRLSIPETRSLFNTLDTTKVAQSRLNNLMLRFWEDPDRESYGRLFNKFGWYSSQYFHQWMEGAIADQCNGNGRATFTDFQAQGFHDLYIVATNISRHRAEIFSATRTPDVAVADAVRMSISIPVFFEALRFDGQNFGSGDYYVDGGVYDNFPMHIFDDPSFVTKSWAYRDNINWETLGLFLFPEQLRNQRDPEHPSSIREYINLNIRNLYYAQQSSGFETNLVEKNRAIEINDCGIRPTETDIEINSEKYYRLYNSGKVAVRTFFELDEEQQ